MDVGNVVPMDAYHHDEQHQMGLASFQRKYEIDLKALAKKYAQAYANGEVFAGVS